MRKFEQVRGIIVEHGQWSRRRISEHLAMLDSFRLLALPSAMFPGNKSLAARLKAALR